MSDPGRALLALDTATSRVVVARGGLDGALADQLEWAAGYRHGETLLPAIERILGPAGGRASVAAIVVGTGPGAFTGLRVGIATAKGLAHGLGCPIVGVSTGLALLAACADAEADADAHGQREHVLLLPAGPSDRVLVRSSGASELLPGGREPSLRGGEQVVAVDLEGRAPADAVARGGHARDGLGAALLRMGAARLARDGSDDLARLVPDYVTLPRGVRAPAGEVAWSRDPR